MMNDVRFMRADTIMKAFQDAGAKVAVITAKDKLRTLLGEGSRSVRPAAQSLFVREGRQGNEGRERHRQRAEPRGHASCPRSIRPTFRSLSSRPASSSCETFRPDVMYLSTTDYIQHKAAPGSAIANAFYAMIDRYVAQLDAKGCVVALDGRSRDERQAPAQWRAGRHLSPGLVSTGRRWSRDPVSSCRSPTPMWPITAHWLVCDRISRPRSRSVGGHQRSGAGRRHRTRA